MQRANDLGLERAALAGYWKVFQTAARRGQGGSLDYFRGVAAGLLDMYICLPVRMCDSGGLGSLRIGLRVLFI